MSVEEIIAAVIVVATAIFGIKYRAKKEENAGLKVRVGELELNEKMAKNKQAVDSHFSGRSDNDVLDEAIERGRKKMPKP